MPVPSPYSVGSVRDGAHHDLIITDKTAANSSEWKIRQPGSYWRHVTTQNKAEDYTTRSTSHDSLTSLPNLSFAGGGRVLV
jgi:hypothetical protein